jgi:uncharacterized protein YcbK (DUF882 family)
LLVGENV